MSIEQANRARIEAKCTGSVLVLGVSFKLLLLPAAAAVQPSVDVLPMTPLPFKQVDVFTTRPYFGNPVAVVFDGDTLSDPQMQQLAQWTNLSETTFVLKPTLEGADYRLRIFTPGSELPFAGHPSLGSAHAVLEAGRAALRQGSLVQECGIGLVRLHRAGPGQRLALDLPQAKFSGVDAPVLERLEAALGLAFVGAVQIVDLGPLWLTGEVGSIPALLAARPSLSVLEDVSRELGITGINLFARGDGATEVRSFAPACGVAEDPVCGSGNGAVASVLRARGPISAYIARQGRCLGRDGYAYLDFVPDGPIRLGGDAVTCIDGHIVPPL